MTSGPSIRFYAGTYQVTSMELTKLQVSALERCIAGSAGPMEGLAANTPPPGQRHLDASTRETLWRMRLTFPPIFAIIGLVLTAASGPALSCRPTLAADAFFEYGASALAAVPRHIVLELAAKAAPHPIENAIIVGHTDWSEGRLGDTSELSMARGRYVKELMVRVGVPAERIYIEHKGESQPIRPRGNQMNARVEIVILYFPPGSCGLGATGVPASK